jgi:hypothetical protein
LIAFEHRFESFDTRGNDCYVDGFAARLDKLILEGWRVLESTRDPLSAGCWQVELFREGRLETSRRESKGLEDLPV